MISPASWRCPPLRRASIRPSSQHAVDELVRVLRLDFAYVRVSDSLEGLATEFARAARRMAIEPHVIGRALDQA